MGVPFEELPRNAGDDDAVLFPHGKLTILSFEELPRNAGDDDREASVT